MINNNNIIHNATTTSKRSRTDSLALTRDESAAIETELYVAAGWEQINKEDWDGGRYCCKNLFLL